MVFSTSCPTKAKVQQHRERAVGPHMIRASVHLRVPNQFMERHRITQGTTIEDFIQDFKAITSASSY